MKSSPSSTLTTPTNSSLPQPAARLAELVGGRLTGDIDGQFQISSFNSLDQAQADELSFCEKARYLPDFQRSKAALVVVPAGLSVPNQRGCIVVDGSPREAMVDLIEQLGLAAAAEAEVAPIAASARIADDAIVEPGVVIGANATVGSGAVLRANAVLAAGCELGAGSVLFEGAVVGAHGFGFVGSGRSRRRFPHIGGVRIGRQVEIGANSCVDRGALGDTIVGDRVKIDNLVQIGHNVCIGSDTVICGGVAIGGSAQIGADCVIGGAAVVKGHIGLADGTVVMGASTILENVRSKATVMGTPMPPMPARQAHRLWRKLLRMSKTGEGKT
ncbi:MAG: UDP-3-O-(3-hydroxymyristoyl)glucosamine N-acyltransferase [Betaproteobacteria bacterium]|nr:UDP-3-O-(3-hydroxymyristoyl)glucosamine N-acyltransferase [Betaproteobacteria bacterium]